MKYTKKILLLFILLIALGISNVYAANGSVTTDGVRVRKSPSTDSEIVTVLNKSASVEILEETGDWYKIKYTWNGTYEGYMSKQFVKKQGEETIPETTPTQIPSPTPTEQPTVTPEIVETPTPVTMQTPEAVETPESEEPEINLLGEKTISSEANVYILPTLTSSIRNTIAKDTTVVVQEIAGNFVYVKYNNESGWIRSNLLQQVTQSTQDNNGKEEPTTTYTEKKGYVNVDQAIVRKKATTASEMVTSLKLNDEVTIVGEESDFYKIKINNSECYIAKFLISDTKKTTSRSAKSRQEKIVEATVEEQKEVVEIPKVETTPEVQNPVPTSSVGEQMAQMAKSYVGYKYVYGGASPTTGFDCSGFVYYICGQLGYKVNRTADNQVYNGVAVEKANLQLGDLVFFSNYKTYTGIGHVGIYIGNNQFVHASTATTGVIISSLDEATYVKRYVTARRIGV